MKNLFKTAVLVSVCFLLYYANAFADVPNTVSLQGRLTTNTGVPITGNRNFTFRLYTVETGGSSFKEFSSNIEVKNGMYSALLDLSSLTNDQLNNSLWVQIEVNNDRIGDRIPLTASPYALSVKNESITKDKIKDGAVTNAKIADVDATKLTGTVLVDRLPSIPTSKLTGTISEDSLPSIPATKLTGTISVDRLPSIPATKLTGTVSVDRLPSIPTSKLTGTISEDSLPSIPATKLTGTISVDRLPSIPATKLTGTISVDRLPNLHTNSINKGEASDRTLSSGNSFKVLQATVDQKGRVTSLNERSMTLPSSDSIFPNIHSGMTKGETSDRTLSSGSSFKVLQATVDQKGRVTSLNERSMNLPSIPDTSGFESTSNKETGTLTNSQTKYPSSSLVLSELNKTVKNTGDENVGGLKTFTNGIQIGDSSGKISLAGNVEISTGLKVNGSIIATGSVLQGADLAEIYPSAEILNPGDVVVISETRDEYIEKSRKAEDTKVAGVVSTKPAIVLNSEAKGYQLALVGKVPVNVTNEGGSIKRGDLLVTSSTGGYAMKAPENPKPGTIIGKALENYTGSRGKILALVNLQ